MITILFNFHITTSKILNDLTKKKNYTHLILENFQVMFWVFFFFFPHVLMSLTPYITTHYYIYVTKVCFTIDEWYLWYFLLDNNIQLLPFIECDMMCYGAHHIAQNEVL